MRILDSENRRIQRKEELLRHLEDRQLKDQESLDKMLEQGIIDDIGVNFLFKRGTELKDGLIDINRAYKIIEKIDNTLQESQLHVHKKKLSKQDFNNEENIYNFDFVKFFNQEDLDELSESSQTQKSFVTTSSVPK